MADAKNVKLVLEWEDAEGKPQSVRWEVDQAKVVHNETRNITPDHVELLKNGVDVKARACLEIKMDYVATVKAEEKKA